MDELLALSAKALDKGKRIDYDISEKVRVVIKICVAYGHY